MSLALHTLPRTALERGISWNILQKKHARAARGRTDQMIKLRQETFP